MTGTISGTLKSSLPRKFRPVVKALLTDKPSSVLPSPGKAPRNVVPSGRKLLMNIFTSPISNSPTLLNCVRQSTDTAATVAVSLGFLYSGTYAWAQLDPAVVTPVPVGSPLYWLAGPTGSIVTPTSSTTTNYPDFAGVSIERAVLNLP